MTSTFLASVVCWCHGVSTWADTCAVSSGPGCWSLPLCPYTLLMANPSASSPELQVCPEASTRSLSCDSGIYRSHRPALFSCFLINSRSNSLSPFFVFLSSSCRPFALTFPTHSLLLCASRRNHSILSTPSVKGGTGGSVVVVVAVVKDEDDTDGELRDRGNAGGEEKKILSLLNLGSLGPKVSEKM